MIRIGIVGGTGYTGVEVLRLLAERADLRIATATSRTAAGQRVDARFPNLRGISDLVFDHPQAAPLKDCDLVFMATPNGQAMEMAPGLLEAGVRVVDVSADFRLRDPEAYARWYGREHSAPAWLAEAVYGLPEVHREAVRAARLVANPGCYPTAIQLGLLPLVEARLVDPARLIASAVSGASGAGRKERADLLLAEAGDSTRAYGAGVHRHQPEIRQGLNDASATAVDPVFVPHLVPQVRGIHATLFAELGDPGADLQALYEARFTGEPFVDVLPAGDHPETRSVRGANLCRLAVHRPEPAGHRVIVLSVIDNLVKGAAGQAIQNMNLMMGLEEHAGLAHVALLP